MRFWSDNWSHLGAISAFLSPSISNSMGIPQVASLQDIYQNGTWRVRPARSDKQVTVQALLSSLTLTTEPDSIFWSVGNTVWKKYSTGGIYRLLKNHGNKVPWYHIFWSKGGIPKHNFMAWLATLNRLPTKDRLLQWGLNVDPNCLLCSTTAESRDHLILECSYSASLWRRFSMRLGLTMPLSWGLMISALLSLTGPVWYKRLCCLVWKLAIYSLWVERNSRLHRQNYRSVDSLAATMDRTIRNRINSLRDANPVAASTMYQFWVQSST